MNNQVEANLIDKFEQRNRAIETITYRILAKTFQTDCNSTLDLGAAIKQDIDLWLRDYEEQWHTK